MAETRAVLTVLGADRVGIVAGVTALLAEQNVNIEDIRMALMGDLFTMIALFAIPAYMSGNAAQVIIKDNPDVSMDAIQARVIEGRPGSI